MCISVAYPFHSNSNASPPSLHLLDRNFGKCYNRAVIASDAKALRTPVKVKAKERKPVRPKITSPDVLDILAKEYGPFPREPRYDPTSELVFTILSQHTSDINSERAFKQLMETFDTFEAVAEGDLDVIAECIKLGGLAKVKAPRIKQVLNLILEMRGSLDLHFLQDMPLEEAKAWLKQLPGIGPKTAAIILSFALGMPAMAVDTHIFRVAKRLGLIGPKTSYDQAHDVLEQSIQPEKAFDFHVALITHGRKVCKAPKPWCAQCVLAYACPSAGLWKSAAASNNGSSPKSTTKVPKPKIQKKSSAKT